MGRTDEMMRREFLATTVAAGLAAGAGAANAQTSTRRQSGRSSGSPFKLNYAPHFGMFRHHAGDDPVDQLRFAADQGFTAWEDNGMAGRSVADQERIASAMRNLGMMMGVFVAHAEWRNPIYALGGAETRKFLQDEMRKAVQVAERVDAKWCTVVPGPYDRQLAWDYQTANVIDCLRAMCEICEPAGLVMVLESLNPYRDHPGMFLTRIPQAKLICDAVDSPSCRILDDLYHQQVTEGNLIPNIDAAWDRIAYFQVGDNPGRCEPTTGEINYRNVFRHIHRKGFTGVVGMEHGNSEAGKAGERAVIDAYAACDSFETD
jgi:hydroxypyruvate isomerase